MVHGLDGGVLGEDAHVGGSVVDDHDLGVDAGLVDLADEFVDKYHAVVVVCRDQDAEHRGGVFRMLI